jgi:hypothetical protein
MAVGSLHDVFEQLEQFQQQTSEAPPIQEQRIRDISDGANVDDKICRVAYLLQYNALLIQVLFARLHMIGFSFVNHWKQIHHADFRKRTQRGVMSKVDIMQKFGQWISCH